MTNRQNNARRLNRLAITKGMGPKLKMVGSDATNKAAAAMDFHHTFTLWEAVDEQGNKLDQIGIQIDNGLDGVIYTTRAGANMLYKRYSSHALRPSPLSSETHNAVLRELRREGHRYSVGKYLSEFEAEVTPDAV